MYSSGSLRKKDAADAPLNPGAEFAKTDAHPLIKLKVEGLYFRHICTFGPLSFHSAEYFTPKYISRNRREREREREKGKLRWIHISIDYLVKMFLLPKIQKAKAALFVYFGPLLHP